MPIAGLNLGQNAIMNYSSWYKWENRNAIPNRKEPAVYFIALSDKNIEGKHFSLIPEIIYIGMTISQKGVGSRLDQFRRGMQENNNGIHGGAERVRFKHKTPEQFFAKAYISVCSFTLSSTKKTVEDWRTKGECAKHEYTCFADYLHKYGSLPEFNDAARSKKK